MQMNSAVDNVDLLRASANREMEVECKNLAAARETVAQAL
jgi:hypothetical protein